MPTIRKVLARHILIEVETASPATYVQVKGLNSVTFSPTLNRTDTSDFDDNGNNAHLPVSKGMQITLDGFRMEDESGGDRDPGQERVEELAESLGNAGLGKYRLTSPGGEVWTFEASAQVTPMGGGNDDASVWQAVVEVSGAIAKA
jgi:hypothetical protein